MCFNGDNTLTFPSYHWGRQAGGKMKRSLTLNGNTSQIYKLFNMDVVSEKDFQ